MSKPTGPACGNNPNHPLTDGDRQAVADFKAYLADRAALRDRIAEALARFGDVDQHAMADAVLALLPPPADRAAIRAAALLWAADFAEGVAERLRRHHKFGRSTGALDVMAELRRVAAEAQQPDTETPDGPRTICVCGHTRAEHLTVSGRILCDACDPDSTDNLTCKEFEAL